MKKTAEESAFLKEQKLLLGQAIKAIRTDDERGYVSLRKMEDAVGIPASNIKYIEDGVNAPSPEAYEAIIKELNPTDEERKELDRLYSLIRGTPPPDVCKQAVQAEYKKGFDGRWGAGLPGSGDMQMLFLQSAIDKMDDNLGRAAIIENGSPLFAGGTSSGESQIRRWMLENDLIEAIIALPVDLFYNTGIATYIWVLSKNKRPERKSKIQLIDASSFFKKLRKALGDKKNEISPEDRTAITRLYADFVENKFCKIYPNEEFIYREYVVMQPLQRSYTITAERIEAMLVKGSLSSLYDQSKVDELESLEEPTGKDLKKLESYQNNQAVYEAIVAALKAAVSDKVYYSPVAFMPVLTRVLASVTDDKKLLEKIADGLSVMDKKAEIQRDRKGNIIYDKETKDTELVKFEENIDDYMAREVLPHIPDAAAFFEENLGAKKPVIKTGAEIPFTRYFYKYQQPTESDELEAQFMELELSVSERVAKLFQ